MKRIKVNVNTFISVIMVITICTACAITYKYANSIIKYEIETDVQRTDIIDKNTINRSAVSIYNEIPNSEGYTLFLKSNNLYVYNSDNCLVYSEAYQSKEMLPENDIRELEQSGIKFNTRSELIEMLNYLNS